MSVGIVNPSGGWASLAARQCGLLCAVAAAVWAVLLAPAWLIAGLPGIEGLSYAALICLVPGCIVMLLAGQARDESTRTLIVVAGGTLLRMAFVLVGLLVIRDLKPNMGFRELTVWFLICYMAMLLAETFMIRKPNAPAQPRGAAGDEVRER